MFERRDLKESFGTVDMMKQKNMVDGLFRAIVRQPAETIDGNFVPDVSQYYKRINYTVG